MGTNMPSISLAIPEDLLRRVDDFKFNSRIKNQTQAVLQLLEKGLSFDEASNVIETDINNIFAYLGEEEGNLVMSWRGLDDYGKMAVKAVLDVELKRTAADAAIDSHE